LNSSVTHESSMDGQASRPVCLKHEVEIRRIAGELSAERYGNRLAAERLARFIPIYNELCSIIGQMQSTKFWKLRQKWFALRKRLRLSPVGAAPHYDPPSVEHFVPHFQNYDRWRLENEYRPADAFWMRAAIDALRSRPRFSLIVPTFNTHESYLRTMLDSVIAQVYPDWELCIADDASTLPHVRGVLEEYAAADPRIRVRYRERNGHICAASNTALEMATGDFIVLLDHDDALSADALFQNALVVNAHPDVDMIYSDEDKLDDTGQRFNAYFKPDWSPDTFLSRMYTCHLGVYRTALVKEIGGFREGFEGSQDYDLVLRLTEKTSNIEHIPRVLYHWRVHPGSTTTGMDAKPYAKDAALLALGEALERRGEPGTVIAMKEAQGTYTIRYDIAKPGKVSVIIPTRDHAEDVDRCLRSLFEKTRCPDFEVILLDNGSKEFRSHELFAEWLRREPLRFKVVRHDVPFNFSAINNYAAQHATGEFLLFLNNDTEITHADWMQAMVEQAQRKSIGAVGAKLLYADGRVQHAGVIIGIGGIAGHSHRFLPGDAYGYFNQVCAVSNFSAVTAACMMLRREVFDEVGGFEEQLTVAYNDVDLCLRIIDKGYRIVYVPHAVLYHYESLSRGYDVTPAQIDRDQLEQNFMEQRWAISNRRDAHYNINLSLTHEDYRLAP
jgi:GT2 family glycosyltransferase